ncbi:MAG: ribonuclease III [Coriobacteriia bacterium]|nr:ribonuclease III [Coriobacteriia bacterium]
MDADQRTEAECALGYSFADPVLLKTALTHPSWAAEHQDSDNYDRLEFLGDSVLGFVVSEYVFTHYPDAPEGELTLRKHNAVSGDVLAAAADAMGLPRFVIVGSGARASGDRSRASVLENAIEAIIGAIYLDGGLDAAREFIVRVLGERLCEIPVPVLDAKGALQQWTQARDRSLPVYRIVHTAGPVHQQVFTAEVTVDGTVIATGQGPSKQSAEKAAAATALEAIRSDETQHAAANAENPAEES